MIAATTIAVVLMRRREGIAGHAGLERGESGSGDICNPVIGEGAFSANNVWSPAIAIPRIEFAYPRL